MVNKEYSKAEIKRIAEKLIEYLRECDDGTAITTRQLLKAAGYDMKSFEQCDLFDIHSAIFKAARANHITLDMSAHKDKLEGLQYNLDYIVRNKKAQIKCPYCGSINTARFIYGLPAFSEEMQRKLDVGKWALGGCCISRKCNDCKKDFGTEPILINLKKDIVEDYRDIVTSIRFRVGSIFRHTLVTINKNDKGAVVEVSQIMSFDKPDMRQITKGKWQKIVNTLYGQMYLHEWKKDYVNMNVLDGTQWRLDITLTNRRKRSYHGSNDYPPYWKELLKVFKEFATK